MVNVILLAVLAAALIFGARSYAGHVAHGCCGVGGGDAHHHVRVKDKNPAHYPSAVELAVSGMTCENCARRVEDALNGIGGVWARVDRARGAALVRMKSPVPQDELRRVVAQAGYAVTEVREEETFAKPSTQRASNRV